MAEDKKEVTTEQPQEQTNNVENGDKKVENGAETQLTNGSNGTTEETQVEQPKEMRSIVVNNFGGIKSVKILKKPEPAQPAEGEVLIRVQTAGVSFNDLLCRQGTLCNLPKPPFSLGFEAAGLVESVGPNVDSLKVGDRVACLCNTQAWSELVLVNSKYVYKLPENIDYDNAVALTLNYVFAYYLLFEVANLKAGQSVFIQSCSGGVGQALVQLASTVENVTIIGTASKSKHEKIENVKHLYDHSDDYVTEIKKEFPEGVNLVLDCLYGDLSKGYGLLKPLGSYVLYGSSNVSNGGLISNAKFWWQSDKIRPMKLFEENKTISGFNLRQFLYHQDGHDHVRSTVEKVYKLFTDGKVKPTIDSRHAFEDVSDAMLQLQERKNIGKVILDVNLQPKPKPVDEEQPVKKSRFSTKLMKKSANKEEKKDDKQKDENNKPEEEKPTEESPVKTVEENKVTNGEKVEVATN